MAPAIDTLEAIDNLTHAQAAADSIVVDIDSTTAEAVKSYAVRVPDAASQCRVLFSNSQGITNGAGRVRVTKVTAVTGGTATKTENTQAMEWTLIPDNQGDSTEIVSTGSINVSVPLLSILHIDCAMAESGLNVAIEIIVQIASEAGVNDSWTTLARFKGPAGTAISAATVGANPSGQKVIGLANPVANNFDNDGKFKMLIHTTIANSEMFFQGCHGADA